MRASRTLLTTTTIATAPLRAGGELSLVQRGDEWSVRVDGRILMSSRTSHSEEALAAEGLARVTSCESILVGGLGLGYTLRAVLDRVAPSCAVHVSELVPELVGWNRSFVGELAAHPLNDPRVQVTVGDVLEQIKSSPGAFDVVLLDVDNGPIAFSDARNQRLYGRRGLAACRKALKPGGILAVWSAHPCTRFERTLSESGFRAETVRVPAFKDGRASHYLAFGSPT